MDTSWEGPAILVVIAVLAYVALRFVNVKEKPSAVRERWEGSILTRRTDIYENKPDE